MSYTIITLAIDKSDFYDILVAELTYMGFDGFEETIGGMKAYINSTDYEKSDLNELIQRYANQVKVGVLKEEELVEQNWNEVWESSFKSVAVGQSVVVKAPFHEIKEPYKYTITIEPKMAFGTGHHATTYLVLEEMLVQSKDFMGAEVLDFGCGTGILAIMASMLGAKHIDAIDNDVWAYENTLENAQVNEVTNITAIQGDNTAIPVKLFDCVLANVNRNVILAAFGDLCRALRVDGHIFFSGILPADIPLVQAKADEHHLQLLNTTQKDDWAMLHYKRLS